jgi:hypothetical protein
LQESREFELDDEKGTAATLTQPRRSRFSPGVTFAGNRARASAAAGLLLENHAIYRPLAEFSWSWLRLKEIPPMPPHTQETEYDTSTATLTAADDAATSRAHENGPSFSRANNPALYGSRTFWRLTSAIVLLAAAYVGYERIGTNANADQIAHLQSYGDDAVAIGMTDRQPGFLLLAQLPASELSVAAAMRSNWLTGQQTIVRIRTPSETTSIRLREPQAIMVHEDGTVINASVPWALADFDQLLHAADCASQCREHRHRCGQPFEDIANALASWPRERVPESLREFLKNHKYRTGHKSALTKDFHHE